MAYLDPDKLCARSFVSTSQKKRKPFQYNKSGQFSSSLSHHHHVIKFKMRRYIVTAIIIFLCMRVYLIICKIKIKFIHASIHVNKKEFNQIGRCIQSSYRIIEFYILYIRVRIYLINTYLFIFSVMERILLSRHSHKYSRLYVQLGIIFFRLPMYRPTSESITFIYLIYTYLRL